MRLRFPLAFNRLELPAEGTNEVQVDLEGIEDSLDQYAGEAYSFYDSIPRLK